MMRQAFLSQLKVLLCCLLLMHEAAACVHPQAVDADTIRAADQGQVHFASDLIGELSGIAYLQADQFLVVSDKGGLLGAATIKIDRETGEITEASIDQIIKLEGGRDLEDLAIDPATCQLITADEADQSIALHHFPSGKRGESAEVPKVFQQARSNLGFESITASPQALSIWAANEEPLQNDGPRATKEAGGLVRLQQFDHELHPTRQFAYRVDPHRGSDNLIKRAQSGVAGLIALPNGELIVMERELGGQTLPSFRTRLYLIDSANATETSKIDALSSADVTPVRKQLLFESNTGLANFEGVTLGPRLDNGDYALIMVSDDGGGKTNPQNLMSLRIQASLIASPSAGSEAKNSE